MFFIFFYGYVVFVLSLVFFAKLWLGLAVAIADYTVLGPVIGIDLRTANARVSMCTEGHVMITAHDQGNTTLSFVAFTVADLH